jgi:hypothetical protein
MGKKSGSGIRIWDEQPGSYFQFFGLKYLNSLMRIRDGKNSDPGWKKLGAGSELEKFGSSG